MDTKDRRQDLLIQKRRIKTLLDRAKKNLGHPHGSWQSAHDLAESEFKVYTAHLESIEQELDRLEKQSRGR